MWTCCLFWCLMTLWMTTLYSKLLKPRWAQCCETYKSVPQCTSLQHSPRKEPSTSKPLPNASFDCIHPCNILQRYLDSDEHTQIDFYLGGPNRCSRTCLQCVYMCVCFHMQQAANDINSLPHHCHCQAKGKASRFKCCALVQWHSKSKWFLTQSALFFLVIVTWTFIN